MQELAVDLLFHFPSVSEQLLRTAALVCLGEAFPTATAVRLLDVLSAKAASGAAEPAAFCGLLLNVLNGSSAVGLRQRSWARHEALVAAACRAALALGGAAEVGRALLPPLVSSALGSGPAVDSLEGGIGYVGGSGSVWAAYGLLQLTTTLAQAAAAAQQPWQPPPEVSAALPGPMLHLQLSCQRQQQDAAAEPPSSGGDAAATVASGVPSLVLGTQEAPALCLRLLSLQPTPLLPQLLAALAGSVRAPQADALLLPAALELLLALLREPGLRPALLEVQAGVHGAVAACRAAAGAAGAATLGGRGCQEQLRQAEGLCAAVLGTM